MENLVSIGRLHATKSVQGEIKDSDNKETLAKWCRQQSGFYIAENELVQKEVKNIMQEYQHPQKAKGIGNADPFVIAIAIVSEGNWRVVSSESESTGNSHVNPNIPFVCSKKNVVHLSFFEMVRVEGWQF